MEEEESNTGSIEFLKSFYVRNTPFPYYLSLQKVEDAMEYSPKDGDIILCSYPKTGSTWLKYIIWNILHDRKQMPSYSDFTENHAPHIHMTGTKPIDALIPPRFYSTHFTYDILKINKNAKYIYIYRNPKDLIASYFYFFAKVYEIPPIMPKDFLKTFLQGNVPYGDYFNHVLSFYEHKNDENFLFISYEDLLRDKISHILKISHFLGMKYYEALKTDNDRLQNISRITNFSYMKQNINTAFNGTKIGPSDLKYLNIFRKGISGDGKELFTTEESKAIISMMQQKLGETDIYNYWMQQF